MILIKIALGICALVSFAFVVLLINAFVKWVVAHEIEYDRKQKAKVIKLDYHEQSLSGDA